MVPPKPWHSRCEMNDETPDTFRRTYPQGKDRQKIEKSIWLTAAQASVFLLPTATFFQYPSAILKRQTILAEASSMAMAALKRLRLSSRGPILHVNAQGRLPAVFRCRSCMYSMQSIQR